MTKEELKDKCAERAKIFQEAMESCKSSNPLDCIEWFADKIIELEKACDETQELLDKQIEATYKVVEENNELKCECRRCIHTDCPCILSDYGKDRNGICDHFKDVFDEYIELKDKLEHRNCVDCSNHGSNVKLLKAKELILKLYDFIPSSMADGNKELMQEVALFFKENE